MTPRPWTVLPNEPIQRIEDNLLCVHGPAPGAIPNLTRTMTVIKRSDGQLLIHSAIALDDASMKVIEAFGEPAFLVIPSQFHCLDAHAYKTRYPALRVFCPKSGINRVRKVVHVDDELGELPPDPAVRVELIEGFRLGEGVFIVHSGERVTLIFNDILLNLAPIPGIMGFLFRFAGGKLGRPTLHPVQKRFADGRLTEHLLRLANLPGMTRIIPGHGPLITTSVPEVLQELACKG